MFFVLARKESNSSTDSTGGVDGKGRPEYVLASVTAAIYILVASTSHDLTAGFSLMVKGPCFGHRAFGIALLTVHGVMFSAAMTVLVSTSHDSTSVLLNAVAVLFVADLVSAA